MVDHEDLTACTINFQHFILTFCKREYVLDQEKLSACKHTLDVLTDTRCIAGTHILYRHLCGRGYVVEQEELSACRHTHDDAGLVSLIVRDATDR